MYEKNITEEDDLCVEEREATAIRLLLRFLELDKETEELKEAVAQRALVMQLKKEIVTWIKDVDWEIGIMKAKFKEVVKEAEIHALSNGKGREKSFARMSWGGFGTYNHRQHQQKEQRKPHEDQYYRHQVDDSDSRRKSFQHGYLTSGKRYMGLSSRNLKSIVEDRKCRMVRKQIKKLEKERKSLLAAKEESEKKISFWATADPRSNLQERFDILEALFTKSKRYPAMEQIVNDGGLQESRTLSEDYFAYDSASSSSELGFVADPPQPFRNKDNTVDDNGDQGEQEHTFAQAVTLLSQINKLLRDTSVAGTNFRLANEAFEAAMWQLRRILSTTARMLDTNGCGDGHLFNSRIDTVKRYFSRGTQYVVRGLRFADGAQLHLASMRAKEFEDLFDVTKIALDKKAGLKQSVHRMKVAVSEAIGALQEGSLDLDLFVQDAKQDREELMKALVAEQERVVEYRSALIHEHVLRSGNVERRLATRHPSSEIRDPTGKSNDKRTSHRNVQLQSFDD